MSIEFKDNETIEELRERLRQMNDAELRRFGRDALYVTSPAANTGQKERESAVIQIDEARAELKRRSELRDSKNKMKPTANPLRL
jgi:hypothetical protein